MRGSHFSHGYTSMSSARSVAQHSDASTWEWKNKQKNCLEHAWKGTKPKYRNSTSLPRLCTGDTGTLSNIYIAVAVTTDTAVRFLLSHWQSLFLFQLTEHPSSSIKGTYGGNIWFTEMQWGETIKMCLVWRRKEKSSLLHNIAAKARNITRCTKTTSLVKASEVLL